MVALGGRAFQAEGAASISCSCYIGESTLIRVLGIVLYKGREFAGKQIIEQFIGHWKK